MCEELEELEETRKGRVAGRIKDTLGILHRDRERDETSGNVRAGVLSESISASPPLRGRAGEE